MAEKTQVNDAATKSSPKHKKQRNETSLPPRRPMTLPEKILAQHAIGQNQVHPGDMICVKVQWTLACEITWKSMDKTYQDMGRPQIWKNDRFWLAVDHTVDPRVNDQPKQKMMIQAAEDFAKEANLTEYQGVNQTILHTEFYRTRAQPGQIVVGADSHSCSTGGLGAFAIGLGAADVVMPLVTGQTWIRVPETLKVEFVGTPPFGMGGKDVMLYTLGVLKCNTVAIGRCVEWTGNIDALSCDARFAIANMTAEFGGIAGIFPADETTAAYLETRPDHKNEALYFRSDADAVYAETFQISLNALVPQVALFPSPDNVQPVTAVLGMALDGCFIGACTTAEEDLILAGLVLQAGLKAGLVPSTTGKRRVTPGSVNIVARLKTLGLLDVYTRAGFSIGAPGCSFCLGIAADVAQPNEVWLSSQNRNYRNRMGKGSEANLASAVTVAASSFTMAVIDPRELLALVDQDAFHALVRKDARRPIVIAEVDQAMTMEETTTGQASNNDAFSTDGEPLATLHETLSGKVQVFGDNVDTDAILPGEFLCENDVAVLGKVAFLHTHPDFRQQVTNGYTIVVGGHGFGCGSSREQAVTALKGAGVKALICRSFGYIFSRNYFCFSLLGIQLDDDQFYALAAKPEAIVTIDTAGRTVRVGGENFRYNMSLFEERLLAGGGILPLYKKFGNRLFQVAIAPEEKEETMTTSCGGGGCSDEKAVTATTDVSW